MNDGIDQLESIIEAAAQTKMMSSRIEGSSSLTGNSSILYVLTNS
jgi:hypothetical protein